MLCADNNGFGLHPAGHCAADDRQAREQLCRYITRRALANERVQTNAAGQVVLKLKTPWHDGNTHLVMSPLEFIQRQAALVPRQRLHRPMTASRLSISGFGCPVRVGQRQRGEQSHRPIADPQVERPDSRRPRSAVADPQETLVPSVS